MDNVEFLVTPVNLRIRGTEVFKCLYCCHTITLMLFKPLPRCMIITFNIVGLKNVSQSQLVVNLHAYTPVIHVASILVGELT